MPQTTPQTFAIIYSFRSQDIMPMLADIKACASHIPKYWAVSEKDRQIINSLFDNAVVKRGLMRVSTELNVTAEEKAHYAELLDAVAQNGDQKKFLLSHDQSYPSTVLCTSAIGGTKESVVQRLKARFRPDLQMPTEATPSAEIIDSPQTDADQRIEKVIDAAQEHGVSSEPDHEVGDLQDVLRAAWELMTSVQRLALLQSDASTNVFDSNGDNNPFADPFADADEEGEIEMPVLNTET